MQFVYLKLLNKSLSFFFFSLVNPILPNLNVSVSLWYQLVVVFIKLWAFFFYDLERVLLSVRLRICKLRPLQEGQTTTTTKKKKTSWVSH